MVKWLNIIFAVLCRTTYNTVGIVTTSVLLFNHGSTQNNNDNMAKSYNKREVETYCHVHALLSLIIDAAPLSLSRYIEHIVCDYDKDDKLTSLALLVRRSGGSNVV